VHTAPPATGSERPLRIGLLALAALALLAGLWAGLVRLGLALPPGHPAWVANHGALMISGFLGTLVSLERALALAAVVRSQSAPRFASGWPFLAPLLSALGALALLLGLPAAIGQALLTGGALALVGVFIAIFRRQPAWPYAVMGLGALAWLAGSLVWWLGQPIYQAAPWWVAFLVLTIAGERLELARVLLLRGAARASFILCVVVLLTGLCLLTVLPEAGRRVAGLGLAGLGLWLLRFDVARHTIRRSGLTRFIAFCLLPGYAWLVAAGLLWVWQAARFGGGPWYDAMLHSVLLGFVFSMIFGHAPLILPAVTGRALPYHPRFYVHLALLHAALVLRVIGDLALLPALRQWGGTLNVVAVLLFVASSAAAVRSASRARGVGLVETG
jgi:hypothetical protein